MEPRVYVIKSTKDYLELVGKLEDLVDDMLKEMPKLIDMATNTSISYNGERVQTSNKSDPVADCAAKIADIMAETNFLEDYYIDTREKIKWQIRNLVFTNQMHYNLLRKRYIERMTIDELSRDIDRTRRRTMSLLEDARKEFEKKYGETYLNTEITIEYPHIS